jgi:hypothetical protein
MTLEVMKRLFPKKYIESTLADDFKDMFHHFLDAQIAFIEEEIAKKI